MLLFLGCERVREKGCLMYVLATACLPTNLYLSRSAKANTNFTPISLSAKGVRKRPTLMPQQLRKSSRKGFDGFDVSLLSWASGFRTPLGWGALFLVCFMILRRGGMVAASCSYVAPRNRDTRHPDLIRLCVLRRGNASGSFP